MANDFEWSPETLTIAVGDSVEFRRGTGTHSWVRDDVADSCALPCTRTFAEEATVRFHCGLHPSMTGTILVGDPPTVGIAAPGAGDVVAGSLVVSGVSTGAATVTVQLGTVEVPATLAPDGAWEATVDTTRVGNGARELVATARSAGGVPAEARVGVSVANPAVVDVAVTRVSAQAAATVANSISFSVENQGNEGAVGLLVRIEYLYGDVWRPVGETRVGVPAFTTVTRVFAWDPPGVNVGRFDIRVVADPLEALADVDRADNTRAGSAGFFHSGVPGVVLPPP